MQATDHEARESGIIISPFKIGPFAYPLLPDFSYKINKNPDLTILVAKKKKKALEAAFS